mmetsp:Transcript_19666/g.17382  ORF Transcript_19666/g.17382 Transcript_19666/m.17382 type:complete len:127 (+) Transcript_19666:1066-1446(+)|eukprot:CAMPEP_0205827096 /NCGR_PEP_ID=MMETSP0206-20130828/30858_1 /ASSEMBLY_ACC=CAM_ASM_000279 /TAXON_ID=36767 /ORGANISM="Euplotes focardii, Strain TN1" /LENGTH=126 /DNA_ID=CAMNT_0053127663 /DNA_START=322 /DNA_END=702 /DNA_ORIENTATION=-
MNIMKQTKTHEDLKAQDFDDLRENSKIDESAISRNSVSPVLQKVQAKKELTYEEIVIKRLERKLQMEDSGFKAKQKPKMHKMDKDKDMKKETKFFDTNISEFSISAKQSFRPKANNEKEESKSSEK